MEVVAAFATDTVTILSTLLVVLIAVIVHLLLQRYRSDRQQGESNEPQEEPQPVARPDLIVVEHHHVGQAQQPIRESEAVRPEPEETPLRGPLRVYEAEPQEEPPHRRRQTGSALLETLHLETAGDLPAVPPKAAFVPKAAPVPPVPKFVPVPKPAPAAGIQLTQAKGAPPRFDYASGQVHLPYRVINGRRVYHRTNSSNTDYFGHCTAHELWGLCWDYNLPRTGSKQPLRANLSEFFFEPRDEYTLEPSTRPWRVLCDDHLPVQIPTHPEWQGPRPRSRR